MIADRVKWLREQHGLSQSELAKQLGITRSSVNAWEMGVSVPSTQYIIELATRFHVSCDFLLCVDSTLTMDISGLKEEDIRILHMMAHHLRQKNAALDL